MQESLIFNMNFTTFQIHKSFKGDGQEAPYGSQGAFDARIIHFRLELHYVFKFADHSIWTAKTPCMAAKRTQTLKSRDAPLKI